MKIQVIRLPKGRGYWRIVAANGKILAHSETYTRYASAMKTAETVSAESFTWRLPIEEA